MCVAILEHHCCQLYIRSSAVIYKTILIVSHQTMKIYLPKLKMSLILLSSLKKRRDLSQLYFSNNYVSLLCQI